MKKNIKQKMKGGLVLKSAELKSMLADPGCSGLGFALEEPGQASNVDLIIHKMLRSEDGLISSLGVQKVVFKEGARSYIDESSDVDHYEFEYMEELVNTGFAFGYLSKDQFTTMIGDHKEVYITGNTRGYSQLLDEKNDKIRSTTQISGTYFTLCISCRSNLNNEIDPSYEPPNRLMTGCPPVWTAQKDEILQIISPVV